VAQPLQGPLIGWSQ